MIRQGIWFIVVVGVFFVGIGIGYAIIPSTPDVSMIIDPQQMQQMMNDPNQMTQWHQIMMNDPQVMDSWMNVILNEPKTRQQMINKMSQEGIEFQELEELPVMLKKQDLRENLLKQMKVHDQNMISLVPYYSEDSNLNEMMTEKMAEHNYLMNQLLNQETMVSELEESIKIHVEEHQQLAELIAGINQMEQEQK